MSPAPLRILGIETSCDETGVGVVEGGRLVLSNVIGSQVELHARYGGIVPEVASRQHVLTAIPIYRQALRQAGVGPEGLDGVAVTVGPGLAGSLLVGVNFAKGLAMGLGLPLFGVNHLEGHVYAAWLEPGEDPGRDPGFPLVCLLASGGHTELLLMRGHGDYLHLGRTRDDAAGEAFDKAARALGLGFPGGPAIQRLAEEATRPEPLPRAWLGGSAEFSFSGLKTALLRRAAAPAAGMSPADLAAGFQEAVVDVLVEKAAAAARRHGARGVLLGGGVAANTLLRGEMARRSPVPVVAPRPSLCTDNGAMVAAAAHQAILRGQIPTLALDATPALRLQG